MLNTSSKHWAQDGLYKNVCCKYGGFSETVRHDFKPLGSGAPVIQTLDKSCRSSKRLYNLTKNAILPV